MLRRSNPKLLPAEVRYLSRKGPINPGAMIEPNRFACCGLDLKETTLRRPGFLDCTSGLQDFRAVVLGRIHQRGDLGSR